MTMDDPVRTTSDAGQPAAAAALALAARLLRGVMIALVPAYLLSGVHILGPREQGVALVLGRRPAGANAIWGPGVHWTLPRPLAEVRRIEAGRVRLLAAGTPPRPPVGAPAEEDDLWRHGFLTAHANLVRARWGLRYTIEDAGAWLLADAAPEAALSNELMRAAVHAAAAVEIDALMRTDLEGVRTRIEAALRDRPAVRRLGVRIERVEAVEMAPPAAVAAAFDDVNRAGQERSAAVEEARKYAVQTAARAEGEAARREALAAAERDRWIATAAAAAEQVRRLRVRYAEHPALVAGMLWQDAVREGLRRAAAVYVLRPSADGRQELRLWIGPEVTPEAHADLPQN